MNRSVFQSSSSSCLWSSMINTSSSTPLFSSNSSSSLSLDHSPLPSSSFLPFSQLLLGGGEEMVGEDGRYFVYSLHDDDDHHHQMVGVKSEKKSYGDHGDDIHEEEDEIIHATTTTTTTTSSNQAWQSLSSPKSSVTTLDHISKRVHDCECNSRESGLALKKAKVQSSSSPSSSQSFFKVRKEKLGDRVAALHQLVSPFGKTDTASVLQEAIGYIRFLHNQIEALSSPYIATASSHSVQGERNCLFIEEQGQDSNGEARDLKSRGLCLVPVSITPQVGSENGADYWAPSYSGSSV